ncbi:MAG: hypothetical protein AB1644_05880 [Candidatus Zixiibacteriota bacterium]
MALRSSRAGGIVGAAAYAILIVALFGSCGEKGTGVSVDQRKKIAGELRDNKLYTAAIEEYTALLDGDDLDNKQRGTISYLIGRVYFEDLKDFSSAAAYFVRAREYDPQGSYNDEASRNLVACFEKMGHLADAKRELNATTSVDAAPHQSGDVEVARIDGTPIWKSEVERQLQSLPPKAQQQFLSTEGKRQFVRQYVGIELMYRAAVREGYDRDPNIQQKRDELLKSLVVDKYVVDKVIPEVHIDTADVRNFYLANKSSRYQGAPYDSVKAQVFLDYQSEKAQTAFNDYIGRLAAGEKVEFLDQNVK